MKKLLATEDWILKGRQVIEEEAEALRAGAATMGESFARACELIYRCESKVVVTGLGKSGHIARKIAATLSSTGSPATYLHPSEALHGDLGQLGPKDLLIAVTYSGETREVLAVVEYARRMGAGVIGLCGDPNSSLAEFSDVCLLGRVHREACPLDLAPSSSTTLALALGDALAISVMQARGFVASDFARFHPGGMLGRRLASVEELMIPIQDVPSIQPQSTLIEVLEALAKGNYGIAAVMEQNNCSLLGVITDGDIRRMLKANKQAALDISAGEIMTSNPKVISAHVASIDAVKLMENFKVTALFVVESKDPKVKNCVGMIRLHDLLQAKVV